MTYESPPVNKLLIYGALSRMCVCVCIGSSRAFLTILVLPAGEERESRRLALSRAQAEIYEAQNKYVNYPAELMEPRA